MDLFVTCNHVLLDNYLTYESCLYKLTGKRVGRVIFILRCSGWFIFRSALCNVYKDLP